MPPVTPSATRLMTYSAAGSGSIFSIFSTALVMTSVCAIVVFLCSPTATRGTDPARSWRARAPAVTTNSNEFGSLLRSIMGKCPDDGFGVCAHPLQPCALGGENRLQPVRGRLQLVVDDDEIVLGERRHFLSRHLQPALNRLFAVLAAPAQPLLEHRERRRHHEHRRRDE